MNPIEILVEWRFVRLLEKLNIDLSKSGNIIWINQGKQLVAHNYITDEKKVSLYGYWVMKKIIWKGIINYDFIFDINELHVNMLYNKYHEKRTFFTKFPTIVPKYFLNKSYPESIENMNNMWNMIINYFMLISIISENLILDVRNEIKKWLYCVMFQIE